MIELKKVSKVISKKTVLNELSIKFEEGSCVALQGHNGCGKSMLLRLLCGLIRPTQGEILLDVNYRFGVIIETPGFFNYETAFYNLKYLASINKFVGDNEIITYLKKLNLYEMRNKKVRTLSLGMRMRLGLCQAFMEDPDVLLLDEPFNALDDENLQNTCEMINEAKKAGKIIVIASHGELPKLCQVDKVIKMKQGSIDKDK